jgi:hypothetical protein
MSNSLATFQELASSKFNRGKGATRFGLIWDLA